MTDSDPNRTPAADAPPPPEALDAAPKSRASGRLPASPNGCPMDSFLRLLMGQWTTYILWVLRTQGPLRFGELRRSIANLSSKVLTERLRMLEEAGVIYRHQAATIPPQVTYGLSDRGNELVIALDELFKIARRWCEEDAPADAPPLGDCASALGEPEAVHTPADPSA